MKNDVIRKVALDIGNNRIKLLVGEMTSDFQRMAVTKYINIKSKGIKKSVIENSEQLAEAIGEAIRKAESLEEPITKVSLALGGSKISSVTVNVGLSFPEKEVEKADIDNLLKEAKKQAFLGKEGEYRILYKEIYNKKTDRKITKNPLGILCKELEAGLPINCIHNIPQTVYLAKEQDIEGGIMEDDIVLHSHEQCLQNKKAEAENYRHIEEESNKIHAQRLLQQVGNMYAVVNPPYPTMATEELDAIFDLPYTRLPHPKYKGKKLPAYEMIKFSINMHQGCFGGCAFCTISAHQGKFVACRSKKSIVNEAKKITQMPDFKGYLSDLGGPSANMYGMHGRNLKACERCKRPSCINPQICPNLDTDHTKLLDIYHAVDALPGIKKSFIGSGVRYDLLLHKGKDEKANASTRQYTRELIENHVSGRLKIAPEHTQESVLKLMRKPSFSQFYEFKRIFDHINKEAGLKQQIIPYFISSHPGCHEEDMAELAVITKDLDFHLEQVQDFTPTPMTISTETWYTGYDPYTLEPVYSAKTPREKLAQRQFFFWYKPEERKNIERELKRIGREDLIKRLFPKGASFNKGHQRETRYSDRPVGSTYNTVPNNRNKARRTGKNNKSHAAEEVQQGGHSKGKTKRSFNPNFSKNNHKHR